MPDIDNDIFEDEDTIDGDLPKKLRAKIKELSSRLGELEQENNSLKTEKRSQTLTETLQTRGLNPKIAKFIPDDLDDDGITSWIEENAEVFGIGQDAQQAQQAVVARDAEQAAAIRQMAAAEKGTAGTPGMESIMSGIENAQSMEELMAALQQA